MPLAIRIAIAEELGPTESDATVLALACSLEQVLLPLLLARSGGAQPSYSITVERDGLSDPSELTPV